MPGNPRRTRSGPARSDTSWDRVATWYDGWVGGAGSRYHQAIALPLALELLDLRPGEAILDVGAGQGVLAPYVTDRGADYTGVDASSRLIELARRRHGREGRFLVGDAGRLAEVRGLKRASFDAAVFVLSLQDMNPLEPVFAAVDWALRPAARLVLVLTHPAFRQPRHSGWGFDEGRGLVYRRVDAYLTPMSVPMKALGDRPPTTSFHRPISAYVNGLAVHGFAVDALREVPDTTADRKVPGGKAGERAADEFPLFLGLRARR